MTDLYDVDIVNAHPCLQFMRIREQQEERDFPCLANYANQPVEIREQLRVELQKILKKTVSLEQAKLLLLRITFGGGYRAWLQKVMEMEDADQMPDFVRQYAKE